MKTTLEGASATLKQGPPGSTQKTFWVIYNCRFFFFFLLLLLGEIYLVNYVGESEIYHFQGSRYISFLMG